MASSAARATRQVILDRLAGPTSMAAAATSCTERQRAHAHHIQSLQWVISVNFSEPRRGEAVGNRVRSRCRRRARRRRPRLGYLIASLQEGDGIADVRRPRGPRRCGPCRVGEDPDGRGHWLSKAEGGRRRQRQLQQHTDLQGAEISGGGQVAGRPAGQRAALGWRARTKLAGQAFHRQQLAGGSDRAIWIQIRSLYLSRSFSLTSVPACSLRSRAPPSSWWLLRRRRDLANCKMPNVSGKGA